MAIRSFSYGRLIDEGVEKYRDRFPEIRDPLDDVVVPTYVHALESIKRDHSDIPLIVVYQPFMSTIGRPGLLEPEYVQVHAPRYERFIDLVDPLLRGRESEGISVLDAHHFYHARLAEQFEPGDGTHMSGAQQHMISKFMAPAIFAMACEGIANRTDRVGDQK